MAPIDDPSTKESKFLPSSSLSSSGSSNAELSPEVLLLLSLCFGVTTLCSLDKVAMSVAVIPMSTQFLYTDSTKGAIASIFSIGYLCGLVPAGLLGSVTSPKKVLSVGVLLWSLAQIGSPFAAYASLPALLAVRFLMGAAEATTIPTLQVLIARWVPESRRSLVLGVVLGGLQVGNVLAYFISPALLRSFGWEGLFQIYGLLGVAWLCLWVPLVRDGPVSDGGEVVQSDQEADSQSRRSSLEEVPWTTIFGSRQIRAIAVAHCVQNFGMYITLAWLPTYYNIHFALSATDSSLNSVGPWVAGALCSGLAGAAADELMSRGVARTKVRKLMQSLALLVPAGAMTYLSSAAALDAQQTELCFVVACSAASACVAGYGASVQDVCRSSRFTSVVYSVASAPAVVAGSAGVYGTGILLDATHDWSLIFRMIAVVYVAGAIYYAKNYSADKIVD